MKYGGIFFDVIRKPTNKVRRDVMAGAIFKD
jgi:hypothetical protein